MSTGKMLFALTKAGVRPQARFQEACTDAGVHAETFTHGEAARCMVAVWARQRMHAVASYVENGVHRCVWA